MFCEYFNCLMLTLVLFNNVNSPGTIPNLNIKSYHELKLSIFLAKEFNLYQSYRIVNLNFNKLRFDWSEKSFVYYSYWMPRNKFNTIFYNEIKNKSLPEFDSLCSVIHDLFPYNYIRLHYDAIPYAGELLTSQILCEMMLEYDKILINDLENLLMEAGYLSMVYLTKWYGHYMTYPLFPCNKYLKFAKFWHPVLPLLDIYNLNPFSPTKHIYNPIIVDNKKL